MLTIPVISFVVHGQAQPAGSKSSFVPVNKKTGQPFRGKAGRIVVNTVDACKKSRPWKNQVAEIARSKYTGPLLECPLFVRFTFYLVRPKCHFGTGRNSQILKADAPFAPAKIPDCGKLSRGVEDALTGVVWRDDCQIVGETHWKQWGESAKVLVEVYRLEADAPAVPRQKVLEGVGT